MSNAYTRLTQIGDAIRAIADKPTLVTEDVGELDRLAAEFEKEAALLRVKADGHFDSDPVRNPGQTKRKRFKDPWALSRDGSLQARNTSPKEWRERALSAVEQMDGASDAGRQNAARIVEEHDDADASLSRLALVTSDPEYMRAWTEMLKTGGQNPLLSEEEVQAIRRVKTEARAMGLTDSAGGFLIPFQLDPAVIITSDGSHNPLRRVAKVVQATGDTYNPVASDAVSWSWDAEAEEVSDDATTFSQPSITIHKAAGFVPISFEALEDAANVTEEVGRLLAFGRDTLTSQAFVTGSGTGEPWGIITALNTVTASLVTAATSGQFGSIDVYAVDESLPARYRQGVGAAAFANRAIWNDVDVMETSNGSKLFEGVVGNPGNLLGTPTYEAEAMDGTVSTSNDYILVYGDFQNYYIADRSSSVEFIPHLFSTGNNLPTGQRGFFAHYRVGADAVNNGAFRLLHNAT